MTDVKPCEEKWNLQLKSCGPVLKIQSFGCNDNLENTNPMKTVIV